MDNLLDKINQTLSSRMVFNPLVGMVGQTMAYIGFHYFAPGTLNTQILVTVFLGQQLGILIGSWRSVISSRTLLASWLLYAAWYAFLCFYLHTTPLLAGAVGAVAALSFMGLSMRLFKNYAR